MNEPRSQWRLNLAIALLVCNLALTGYLIYSQTRASTVASGMQPTNVAQISPSDAEALASRLVTPYNKRDIEGVYAQFSTIARVQITKESIKASLDKLHSVVGRVDEYAYSHTENAGSQNGKQFVNVFYKVKLSGGPMSTGDLKITAAKDAESFAIYSFFLSASQQ